MDEVDQSSSTTFNRQRRDLFVITIILLIALSTNLKVDRIDIYGIHGDLSSTPGALRAALVTFWGYWLLRYCWAYAALGSDPVTPQFRHELHRQLTNKARKFADAESIRVIETQNPGLQRLTPADPSVNVIYERKGRAEYLVTVNVRHENGNIAQVSEKIPYIIEGPLYCWLWLKSALYIAATRMELSEYWLPFVFGLTPVGYIAFQAWYG